jgi:hypothetical protein
VIGRILLDEAVCAFSSSIDGLGIGYTSLLEFHGKRGLGPPHGKRYIEVKR